MTQHFNFKGRDIVSIKDFPRQELDYVLEMARKIDPASPETANLLNGKVMATLFFEPSTRTRLSFEAAMKRLGGNTIGFTEPGASSVEKGETLADTVRVVENYVDIIVMRHPREGSARLAAECVSIPVINAGSGAEEHPTQAFLDMLTIRNEKGKLDGLNIGLLGDLRYGRTVHSLTYALSHYDLSLHLVSPPQLRMRREVLAAAKSRIRITESSGIEEVLPQLDVLYVTRIQKERFPDPTEYEKVKGIYKIDLKLLEKAKSDLIIMHPLPRVDEIAPEVDETKHALYFKQVKYGLTMRMTLLGLLLGAL